MYDNILHKPLAMRPGASSTAWSLLQALLEKDGTYRLGSRDDFVSTIQIQSHCVQQKFSIFSSPWWVICIHHTATNTKQMYGVTSCSYIVLLVLIDVLTIFHFQNEIKAHNFFSSINWDDLEQKKILPPFTPKVVNSLSLAQ